MGLLPTDQIRKAKKSPLKIEILEHLQQGPCSRDALQEYLNAQHPRHPDYWAPGETGNALYELTRDHRISREGRGGEALYRILEAGEVYLREAITQERG